MMQNIKNTNNYQMKIFHPYMNYKENFLITLMKKIFGRQQKNKWEVYFKNILKVLIKIQQLDRKNFLLKIIKNK